MKSHCFMWLCNYGLRAGDILSFHHIRLCATQFQAWHLKAVMGQPVGVLQGYTTEIYMVMGCVPFCSWHSLLLILNQPAHTHTHALTHTRNCWYVFPKVAIEKHDPVNIFITVLPLPFSFCSCIFYPSSSFLQYSLVKCNKCNNSHKKRLVYQ